jgi:predicted transposase YbfD/YdcC
MDLSIFVELVDSRRSIKGAFKYKLEHLIFMSIVAILSGMNNWSQIEEWCQFELDWINAQLGSAYSRSPSDDTIRRLFISLDHVKFNNAVRDWLFKIKKTTEDCHLILDGKTAKGSRNKNSEAIHTVHAFAKESGLVFSASSSDGKGNEISGIKDLLDSLSLKNSVISIDAIGCQHSICKKITDKEGYYVIALKSNQGNLFDTARDAFNLDIDGVDWIETIDKQSGGIYMRRYGFLDNPLKGKMLEKWFSIKNIVLETTFKDDKLVSNRYFISSLNDIEYIAKIIRNHWSIENGLHWILDVVFRDDESKCYIQNSAHNFCTLRRTSFNLIQLCKTSKDSFRSLRLSFDKQHSFRDHVLNNLKS